jgi:hypothetical protein
VNLSTYWRISELGGTCPPTGGLKVFIFFHLTFNFFTVHVSLIYSALSGLKIVEIVPFKGLHPLLIIPPRWG